MSGINTESFVNYEQFEKRLDAAVNRVKRSADEALYKEGVRMATMARERAPIKFGVLRASAYCTFPENSTFGKELEIGFGGPAYYAVTQHEKNAGKGSGMPFFLKTVVDESSASFSAAIAARMKKSLSSDRASVGVLATGFPTTPWNAKAISLFNENYANHAGDDDT